MERSDVLAAARKYYESLPKKEFVPGQTYIPVTAKSLDGSDLEALIDSSLDMWLTAGRFSREFARQHDRPFKGVTAGAMALLVEAPWPGNVRQLRNLIESMVVLAPSGEIRADDIPPEIRDAGARNLPVLSGPPPVHEMGGQVLQYILNSLLDLRIQVEDLRRRIESRPQRIEYVQYEAGDGGREAGEAGEEVLVGRVGRGAGGPIRDVTPVRGKAEPEPAGEDVVWEQGMKMADVERAAIASALRATRGNRRKAAEMLGIGERTLYRKLKEYHLEAEVTS